MAARDPQWRAEDEAYEQLAATAALRGQRLDDVARWLLHRGDVLVVHLATVRLRGRLVHAAGDLLCLRTATDLVDVNVAQCAAIEVAEHDPAAAGAQGGGARSFGARLAEHEAAGVPLEFGVDGIQDPPRGRLAAVAADHVVVGGDGGRFWFLPRARLQWVRPLGD